MKKINSSPPPVYFEPESMFKVVKLHVPVQSLGSRSLEGKVQNNFQTCSNLLAVFKNQDIYWLFHRG